jgi:hypothetical protein
MGRWGLSVYYSLCLDEIFHTEDMCFWEQRLSTGKEWCMSMWWWSVWVQLEHDSDCTQTHTTATWTDYSHIQTTGKWMYAMLCQCSIFALKHTYLLRPQIFLQRHTTHFTTTLALTSRLYTEEERCNIRVWRAKLYNKTNFYKCSMNCKQHWMYTVWCAL